MGRALSALATPPRRFCWSEISVRCTLVSQGMSGFLQLRRSLLHPFAVGFLQVDSSKLWTFSVLPAVAVARFLWQLFPLAVLNSLAPQAVWKLQFAAHISHLALLGTKSSNRGRWRGGHSSNVTLRCGSTQFLSRSWLAAVLLHREEIRPHEHKSS